WGPPDAGHPAPVTPPSSPSWRTRPTRGAAARPSRPGTSTRPSGPPGARVSAGPGTPRSGPSRSGPAASAARPPAPRRTPDRLAPFPTAGDEVRSTPRPDADRTWLPDHPGVAETPVGVQLV